MKILVLAVLFFGAVPAEAAVITVPYEVLYSHVLAREFPMTGIEGGAGVYKIDEATAAPAAVALARAYMAQMKTEPAELIAMRELMAKWEAGTITAREKDQLLLYLAQRVLAQ